MDQQTNPLHRVKGMFIQKTKIVVQEARIARYFMLMFIFSDDIALGMLWLWSLNFILDRRGRQLALWIWNGSWNARRAK